VSNNRHGVIGVKVEAVPPAAFAKVMMPPAPTLTAIAAPIAAQRAR
jgi:hypothetical protein